MTTTGIESGLLEAAQARLPADALANLRRTALARFAAASWPTTRDEDWKYTSLSGAAEIGNAWLKRLADEGPSVPDVAALPAAPHDIDAHWLVLHDGALDAAGAGGTLEALAAQGVTVTGIDGEAAGAVSIDGALDSLNAALLRDGLHIRTAAGASLDKPLAILFSDGAEGLSQSRIIVDVGEGARLDLIELHRSAVVEAQFANVVTQMRLAPSSQAALVRLQERDARHQQVGKLSVRLERDTLLDYASFDFGGAMLRQDVAADIVEPGAAVRLHGLYLAGGRQHIDNHTRVDHRVGPASSREEFRGILTGRARCVFNGKAIVHEGADGSDAEQSNHNLLLSARAEVDTKPELEIYADDVKCSHGATVGELDAAALFYLQSRGLDREQAAHVLTRAFAGRTLAFLPIDSLRGHIGARIDARLDELLEEDDE